MLSVTPSRRCTYCGKTDLVLKPLPGNKDKQGWWCFACNNWTSVYRGNPKSWLHAKETRPKKGTKAPDGRPWSEVVLALPPEERKLFREAEVYLTWLRSDNLGPDDLLFRMFRDIYDRIDPKVVQCATESLRDTHETPLTSCMVIIREVCQQRKQRRNKQISVNRSKLCELLGVERSRMQVQKNNYHPPLLRYVLSIVDILHSYEGCLSLKTA